MWRPRLRPPGTEPSLQFGSAHMDRNNELLPPAEEHPTTCTLSFIGSKRIWKLPHAIRVMHTGFKDLGLEAPNGPENRTGFFPRKFKAQPHILTYPGPKFWLVTTATLDGGEPPTDLFADEPYIHRVDGLLCPLTLTYTSHGVAYMATVDITSSVLAPMTDRVLESEPGSRILVRFLPRYAKATLRWSPSTKHLQFWTPI